MASQHRPSAGLPPPGLPPPGPLPPTAAVHRTRTTDRGHSRFVEPPMYEYTPAHSLYEGDTEEEDEYVEEEEDDDDDGEYRPSTLRRTLRGVNAGLHIVACILLLTIMALFIAHARRLHVWYHHTEPQAVTLIILLAFDMVVDASTLVRLWRVPRGRHHHHPGSVVIARLALGVGYLALFMVDVGIGAVFAQGYAFWGLTPHMAGPVVYLFLWMLGVWDLLHTALHRHQVGRSVRAGREASTRWWTRRRGGAPPGETTRAPAAPPPPPPPAQAVAMQRRRPVRTVPQTTLGLPPPVGSTPTTATAPPNALTPAVTTGGGGGRQVRPQPDDKPLSSSVSSASTTASMSTQATRVERPGKEA